LTSSHWPADVVLILPASLPMTMNVKVITTGSFLMFSHPILIYNLVNHFQNSRPEIGQISFSFLIEWMWFQLDKLELTFSIFEEKITVTRMFGLTPCIEIIVRNDNLNYLSLAVEIWNCHKFLLYAFDISRGMSHSVCLSVCLSWWIYFKNMKR